MSVGLSRTDLSDDQNVRDCVAEYTRARDSDGNTAKWVSRWGDALIELLEVSTDKSEIDEATEAANSAENRSLSLEIAINHAVELIDIAISMSGVPDEVFEKVNAATGNLEKALAE